MPLLETATGAILHYEDTDPDGGQTPVVLIHGMLGTARSQLGHVIDWLAAQGFRAIGLTLRGYGESLPKPRDFPPDFYHRDCADVLAFMDAAALPQLHLIGYSDGGEVALIAAGTAPERVASCIAIGAIGNFGPELRSVFQRSYPGDWISDEDKRMHGFSDAARFTGAWVRSMTRMIDAGGDVSLSLASNITCPLLIMLGEFDKLNPVHYGQRYVERVSRGRLAVFPCGHAVHDQARDQFYEVTLRHLLDASAGNRR